MLYLQRCALIATRHATSLQRPSTPRLWWCWAGESSRKPRRPHPYSHCGEDVAGYAAPTVIYAKTGINGNGEWEDNDAARRVATSFGERENQIETAVFQKGDRGKACVRGILYRRFSISSVKIAFNHAISFLEDCSDAACRIVFIGLHQRITCRSIVEIGYCILGRGDAVGAGRELPAHPRECSP